GPASRRGIDGSGDRGADRADARIGSREPAPRDEAPARAPRSRRRTMSEDEVDEYLWDRSGASDPEVERLEGLLGRYRWRRRELRSEPRSRAFLVTVAAIAASVAAVALFLAFGPRHEGAPGYRLVGVEGREVVRAGEAVTTGEAQRVQL